MGQDGRDGVMTPTLSKHRATPGKPSMRQTSQYGIQGAVQPSTGVVGIFP